MWAGFVSVDSNYDPIIYEGHTDVKVCVINAGPANIFLRSWDKSYLEDKKTRLKYSFSLEILEQFQAFLFELDCNHQPTITIFRSMIVRIIHLLAGISFKEFPSKI